MENENIQKVDDVLQAMIEKFAEIAEVVKKGPDAELIDYILGLKGRVMDARNRVKQQYPVILRTLDNEDKAIDYVYGLAVQQATDRLLAKQKGKQKSIGTKEGLFNGRAGYRSGDEKLVINDMQAAIKWCGSDLLIAAMNKIDAGKLREFLLPGKKSAPPILDFLFLYIVVTGLNVGPLYEHYKATCKVNTETGEVIPGEIPAGCEIVSESENFYAKPATLKLTEGKETE